MIEFFNNMNVAGWITILLIASMIFTVLMMRGIQFGWGDKSVAIGKKFDDKLDTFKKDLEIKNIKKTQDETLQKTLFKKSLRFDEYLYASLVKSVKKLESEIYKIFKPFLVCQYPALCVVDIFEDALMEKVHFNNMKKKLMKENRDDYLDSIVEDIKKNYLVFYEQMQSIHCGEKYPEWEKIKDDVIILIKKWFLQCLDCYIVNVKRKIELYQKTSKKFILDDMRTLATNIPIKKNKYYLNSLLKAKKNII